jgi:hypothetical protein
LALKCVDLGFGLTAFIGNALQALAVDLTPMLSNAPLQAPDLLLISAFPHGFLRWDHTQGTLSTRMPYDKV